MGRSDRAHAGFHRVSNLLEELAGLAPTKNLRSNYIVLEHRRHIGLLAIQAGPRGVAAPCVRFGYASANARG